MRGSRDLGLIAPARSRASTLLALMAMLVPAAALAQNTAATGVSADSAVGGDQTRTRFVAGLDKAVEFQVFSLSNPNRVIVDLPDVKLQLPALSEGKSVGLIQAVRGGLSAPGRSRIVIDVTAPVIVENAKVEKSKDGKAHSLALEIVPAGSVLKKADTKPLDQRPFALGAVGLQPPLPKPAERPEERAARAFKPIIVIDPGHGGHDSGAMKNGAVEKDVVLAFARVLREKIEDTGRFKVLMTRDADVFIPLDERRDFAERNKASLFIAVHADYASTKARGATIYSLRESVAKNLQRSAKNGVSEQVLSSDEVSTLQKASGDLDVVKSILSDLALRDLEATQERTNVFTRSVIEYMGASTNMRDDPDQQASFRVLKTAQFPSVLIELAYVTNKEDAELLQSSTWREKVASSIMTAVENYFSHQVARLPL